MVDEKQLDLEGNVKKKEKKTRRKLTEKEREFEKQKRELRTTHKRLKVGLITVDDLDDKQKELLSKYYGWEFR